MSFWGILVSIAALAFGAAGVVFLFWGYNRHNRGLPAAPHFWIAGACALGFAGLLYLGGRLGLLW